MKSRIVSWGPVLLILLLAGGRGFGQTLSSSTSRTNVDDVVVPTPARNALAKPSPSRVAYPTRFRPFSKVGIDAHVALGGLGFDVAAPLTRKFNVRAGSDFFGYSTTFQEQGANIAVSMRLRSGHASLDYFPFGGRFRLSPLIVFANNNRVQATAVIPSGSTVTLNGQDYISSLSDPLHGSGSVDFRKASPGFTLGFSNIVSRTRSHFSIPTEVGFYYEGQPGLKVRFGGSACDPTLPSAIGCQSVDQDASFQRNLAAFIKRNNNNLSYASFFPVFSTGIGYSF